MEKVLMIAADVHDENVLTKFAVGRGAMAMRSFRNNRAGRQAVIGFLQEWAAQVGATRIVFGYEASGSGYLLRDELVAAGIECHVLAPSKIERSPAQRRRKTDEKDAERILEVLRGFVLAGNRLPAVWVPDLQTRDDREVVRAFAGRGREGDRRQGPDLDAALSATGSRSRRAWGRTGCRSTGAGWRGWPGRRRRCVPGRARR